MEPIGSGRLDEMLDDPTPGCALPHPALNGCDDEDSMAQPQHSPATCHRDGSMPNEKTIREVPFYLHNIEPADIEALTRVLQPGQFLTTAKVTQEFEDRFATRVGAPHCVAVMSATHALELALMHIGVGPGDEVIVPSMTFVATANVVEQRGATPVFCDCDATGCMDMNALPALLTPNTKAVIPVHLYGQMCDMHLLTFVLASHSVKQRGSDVGVQVKVIEDCAHCVEGARDGKLPGQAGDYGCFSFYATKAITCGEGGAIVCKDLSAANWFRLARLHGMTRDAAGRQMSDDLHYDVKFVGMKCNMPDLMASLLLGQLARLGAVHSRKSVIAGRYLDELRPLVTQGLLAFPEVGPGVTHAWHLFVVLVLKNSRDDVVRQLRRLGIGCTVNYLPVHHLSYYADKYPDAAKALPMSEWVGKRCLSLPLYSQLVDQDVTYVVRCLKKVFWDLLGCPTSVPAGPPGPRCDDALVQHAAAEPQTEPAVRAAVPATVPAIQSIIQTCPFEQETAGGHAPHPKIGLAEGSQVVVSGLVLESSTGLNGYPANVLSWDATQQRYAVQVQGWSDPVLLRPENIKEWKLTSSDGMVSAPSLDPSVWISED
eukprot:gene3836-709_t